MEYTYEVIQGSEGLPVKIIIHAIDEFQMHWHNEIELLLVLEGSISIRVGENIYYLEENDIILINSDELHSTRRTKDENVLLAVQIDSRIYSNLYPEFNKMRFNCKSFQYEEDQQEVFDTIRHYIAKIVWELNKKDQGYEFRIGSNLYLLGEYILNNCEYKLVENEDIELRDSDLARLQRIMEYVSKNSHKKITLKEIAEMEHLNYYYLSHFIKQKTGMSFQEYLNTIRLDKAIKMLISTDMPIIDISNNVGFSNINSFNNLFRDSYNTTPTEFRKNQRNINWERKRPKTYLDVDRNKALEKLFSYLDMETSIPEGFQAIVSKDIIHIDGKKTGKYFKNHWQNLTTFGRAHEGLRSNWRQQLVEMQKEIGFNYIRFHGIFMDEMMIYNKTPEGNIEYNWTYVDELFDFFLENNIKPFVELGFMPDDLKKTDETIFWWKGNISPPKDMKLWTDLVEEFIKHCINRYGQREVESWYFEIWNEPEYAYVFWSGTKEEYFEFYKETTLAIKSISDKLKVGGPAITHGTIFGSNWLEDFLNFCKAEKLPLDFISIHIYPEYISDESIEEYYRLVEEGTDINKDNFMLKKIYYEEDHVIETIDTVKDIVKTILGNMPEFHITEWNASSQLGNLIHDTCYVSTYIVKNVLATIDKVDSLGYWTFTDIFEEQKLGTSHFHGGFGLINKDGIKKPSYYAYYFLSKLGNEIIEQGEDYIITRFGEDIQILAYNCTYFDDLFISGETSHINHRERYEVYENKGIRELEFELENILGQYKIIDYKLNRESGSAFDEWINMGMPENMSAEEIKHLKGKSQPEILVEYRDLKGKYKTKFQLPAHGIEMVVLEKQI
ncbi:MAG: helix-turn-helix domain-containing protein [Tissierellia bacterium]|nr:helix-turn-helix domain-containing protein [Tissierellia bacterium]